MGSGRHGLRAFAGPDLRRELLERGWAVFYPNPRGSFGQGEMKMVGACHTLAHLASTSTRASL